MAANGISASSRKPDNGSRPDPVAALRFQLDLGKVKIGYFEECSGLGVEVEVKEYPEGGRNDFVHKLPTRVKYQNVVLKRGVTHEDALLKWFRDAQTNVQANAVQLTVTLKGPGGEKVRAWSFSGAYPVKWTGPTLTASSNAVASETLEIAHTGMTVA